ncbi:hypothetical protein CR513_16017, partial [Mucuna pruriens]
MLALLNFHKSFELECDAPNVDVRIVLLQQRHPIAFFSEKLKGAQITYSTYYKELNALVQALQFLEQFLYVIKYKQGKATIMVDALSKSHALIAMLKAKLLGFESLKGLYMIDVDSSEASFGMKGSYLKKSVCLCSRALSENYW